MKKYIGLLLLIIVCNLSSQTIDVKTGDDFLQIKIYSLQSKFNHTKYSNQEYLQLRNIKQAAPRNTGQILVDEIQLIVALPDNDEIKLETKLFSKRLLSNRIAHKDNTIEPVSLQKIGRQRGVNVGIVKINPFSFDDYNNALYIFDSIEIVLKFERPIATYDFNTNNPEYKFFSEYINKTHLPELLKRSNNFSETVISNFDDKNQKVKLLSEEWYNPDINYVKLTTKNDGIAKVTAQDLITSESTFLGKNVNYIHLLYKGEEVPVYINNDSDGLLNTGDEIIFLGHRGEGDTTWFNNYSDFSAYYLYYDDSKSGLRFRSFSDINNATDKLEFVNTTKHYELEKDYMRGDSKLQWDIENIHRELWFWQRIDSDKLNKFDFNFNNTFIDTLTLNIRMLSLDWSKEQINKHNLSLVVNKDTSLKFTLDTGKILNFEKKLFNEKLVFGNSNINLINHAQFVNNPEMIRPNDIAIDYIELTGKSKPIASNGIADFTIEKQTSNFILEIPNVRADKTYLLDKTSNLFTIIQGQSGTNIIAGTKSGSNPWSSIIINDSSYSSSAQGSMNIAILKAPDYKNLEFRTFTELSNQIVDFLNTASTGSIVTVTYNLDKIPSANIISKLQNLGSKLISQVKNGDSWILTVKTDDISKAVEILNTNGPANLQEFVKHTSGKSYIAQKQLSANTNFDISAYDIQAIENATVYSVGNSQLRNENHRADAIIITHNKFKEGSDSLAEYRRSRGYEVEVVDVEDIYKEFNFGIKSPHAIKSFLHFAYNNWQKPTPQFLLIIGDASWDSRNKTEGSVNIDYVPSYGWPVCDYWYACLDTGKDYLAEMFVGRIPAIEKEHVFNVLNKIKEYDAAPRMPWMKKLLSLTGGKDDVEKENFKDNMDGILYANWMETPFVGDTMIVAKKSSAIVGVAEANEIIAKIDAGAIWVNFYGHGAPDVFDMDGWHPDKLNNKGKYSFFTTISCNTAAFAEPKGTAKNADYLTIGDKGFIGTGGSASLGLDIPGMQIASNMMKIVTDSTTLERSLGEILNNAKIPMIGYDPLTRSFAQQFTLLGDPMTKIRIPTTRDIYTIENEVKITNFLGNSIIIDSDTTAHVNGIVYNNGYCEKNNLSLMLIHKYHDEIDTFNLEYQSLCIKEIFRYDSLKILNRPGNHEIEIYAVLKDTILPVFTKGFEVFKSGLLALEPLPYWNMDAENLHFRFINPVQDSNSNYEFYLSSFNDVGDEEIVYTSKNDEVEILENCIDWIPVTTLNNNMKYFVYARYINQKQNIESDWLRIPFYTSPQEPEKVKVNLNNEFLREVSLENLILSKENNSQVLKFNDIPKSFNLISARGNPSVDRYGEIVYDDEIYIFTPSTSNAPVGINLIVVSGKDGKYLATRKYNTWDGENSTRNLVKFLNDTVETGDWILMASCGSAWRMFYHTGIKNPDSIGSFKTFKAALSNYGSIAVNEIPEINDIPQVSFALAGRKGFLPGQAMETISPDGSKISINDSLTIYYNEGIATTTVIFLAKSWDNCKINASIDYTTSSSTISLWGIASNNSFAYLGDFHDTLFVDLSFIDANIFPKIAMDIKVKRTSEDENITISNIEFNFSSSPELAIVKSKTSYLSDTVMRGQNAQFNYEVENLSLRSTSEVNYMQFTLQPEGLNEFFYLDTLPQLSRNQSKPSTLNIETNQLTDKNISKITANYSNSISELYTFNNFTKRDLFLRRDNEKPFIKIFADDVEIKDSSYVSISPNFKIELYDYSYEPVLSLPEPIRPRINSIRQTDANTVNYKLELVNQNEFKAILSFKSDTLFDWDNRIEVVFQDAAGNMDTVEYHIFTALNAFITGQQVEPNPINDDAKFTFSYRAMDNSGTFELSIFDITGKRIKTFDRNLNIGKNEIEWDGFDEYGNQISQGVYIYLIRTKSENYSDPVTGKFIKLR